MRYLGWMGCVILLAGANAAAKGKCDGVTSTTKPAWCIKPPPGYELDAANPVLEAGTQVFRDKASNQAFTVGWYPEAGGVEAVLKRMRSAVPAEGGSDLKEESKKGAKVLSFKTARGTRMVMVLAAAGPGPDPGTERVVTCKVNLAEANPEFAKQATACKTLKVLP